MIVQEQVVTLAGWPTEVVKIASDVSSSTAGTNTGRCDTSPSSSPHRNLVVIFVPGNPGCVGWYTSCLQEIVHRLQVMSQMSQKQQSRDQLVVTARGVSHAGHSPQPLPPGITTSISFTLQGQIEHKSAFVDWILKDMGLEVNDDPGDYHHDDDNIANNTTTNSRWPSFIFVSHSIGSYIVERLLITRPDILRHTMGVLHLMPFTRMHALPHDQARLDWGSIRPELLIRSSETMFRLLQSLPRCMTQLGMMGMMDNPRDRELAVNLILRRPSFPRTFFTLGTEEIRTVPKVPDVSTLQVIASQCPMAMLYGDHDQWAPKFHMLELQELQQQGVIPSTISLKYHPNLRHDFVSRKRMVPVVIDWCCDSIQAMLTVRSPPALRSKM